MPEQSENFQNIMVNLDAAAKELRAALEGVEQAQTALQHIQKQDNVQRMRELEALWQHLNNLGRPVINVGAHVIGAMQEIGQQIGASPTAPSQLDWLVGIEVRASHVEQARQANQELQQRATALLAWLEPYLERVSPRTRTAVTLAIKKAASGDAPPVLIERLTPETFRQDLQRAHTGFVANIRGLGPRGLRELREAMGVDEEQ